jgi:hypothetical protein
MIDYHEEYEYGTRNCMTVSIQYDKYNEDYVTAYQDADRHCTHM